MTFDEYCKVLVDEANSPKYILYKQNVLCSGNLNTQNKGDFKYRFEYLPYYNKLNKRFALTEIAEKNTCFNKTLNIMQWLTEHTQYCGYSNLGSSHPNEIISYSFGKGFDGAINCANKAILLSDLLMAVEIFAMPVWLNNEIMDVSSEWFGHGISHVVVHAYIGELDKWVMFDPSFNSYFTDEENNPLNLVEILSSLRHHKVVKLAQYSLNGTDFFRERYAECFVFNGMLCMSIQSSNAFDKRCSLDYYGWRYRLMPVNLNYIAYLKNVAKDDKSSDKVVDWANKSIEVFKSISVDEFTSAPQHIITQ